jgi:hypothetical protein
MGDFARVKIDKSAPYDLFGTAIAIDEENFEENATKSTKKTAAVK